MRLPLPLLATVLAATALTACSRQDDTAFNRSDGAADSAPNIAPSAAPDVAFTYGYRFALAANDIAAVQEKHAAACEALGLDRCRITGVAYRRSGSDRVSAALSLALAPDIARKFGKDATGAVEAARGTLSDLEIGGEDHGSAIAASTEAAGEARAERLRTERALADRATPDSVKRDLQAQLVQQRAAEQAAGRAVREARAPVAMTPMHFAYSTDGYMPGLSIDRTARAALGFAGMVLNAMVALLVVLLSLAVPLGIALLGLAHARRFAQRLWARLAPAPALIAE